MDEIDTPQTQDSQKEDRDFLKKARNAALGAGGLSLLAIGGANLLADKIVDHDEKIDKQNQEWAAEAHQSAEQHEFEQGLDAGKVTVAVNTPPTVESLPTPKTR